eukprot:2682062-Prorocentrum_lima.AAC.1
MTSSLVGSEMCIRDRLCQCSPVSLHLLLPPPYFPSDLFHPSATRSVPAPVSYTHLTLPTICSV